MLVGPSVRHAVDVFHVLRGPSVDLLGSLTDNPAQL